MRDDRSDNFKLKEIIAIEFMSKNGNIFFASFASIDFNSIKSSYTTFLEFDFTEKFREN